MSLSKLLRATRNHLQSRLSPPEGWLGVRPDARPPATCGKEFLAIYGIDNVPANYDSNTGVDSYYSVAVSLTFRINYSPFNLLSEEAYLKDVESMEERLEAVVSLVHQNFDLMGLANQYINKVSHNLIEPLRWQGTDPAPDIVDNEWFQPNQDTVAASRPNPWCGLVMEARFGNARRKITLTDYRPY